jgi:hypothetical protein
MAKQIAKLLKTDVMADIDLPAIAQFLQSQGRRGDSILAHINPKEAALLQRMGGAATENPMTGLPEFYEGYDENDALDQYFANMPSQDRGGVSPMTAADVQGYSDAAATGYQEVEPRADIFSQPYGTASNAQTITPDYLSDYNVRGTGDFGFSPAVMGADRFGTVPTTLDRFNVPNVAKGFDERGFPTMPGATPAAFPEREAITGAEGLRRAGEEKGLVRRGVDYLKEATGLSGNELARLGLAAGLGIQGAMGAREAAEQGRQARAEQEEIARPYRERGATLIQQAETGQLTPQGQQSLAAMRARLAQGAEARGGVGAQQAAAQIENYRQQLLANQYDYGMKISNIGDQLMLGAIRTGLEADRYATQMTNSYYTNMARILVGMGANNADVEQITKPRV